MTGDTKALIERARTAADQLDYHYPGIAGLGIALMLRELADALERADTRDAVMLAALTEIAAFDDELANRALTARGSYGGFDEPGSVQTAREALVKISHS
ncbi:MAG: hypothetical protein KGL39_07775 [Patescibacteria group bacterium]|nr:hypothetical protein [Patescibacteria group bacterium]